MRRVSLIFVLLLSALELGVGLRNAFADEPSSNDTQRSLNFTNDVLPVLTKSGCNAGTCHGKAIGQNGFKLSLYGFDPESDFAALVHESRGRRVSPAAPGDSLMLLKATSTISADGKLIAVAAENGSVHFHDSVSGAPVTTIDGCEQAVVHMAVASDGKLITATADGQTSVYQAKGNWSHNRQSGRSDQAV